ncbi:hypothetical protein PM082_022419 [Marasmius tenuissimus]|nr:hypothetical protein PM082_022419 [Marasmius tenuissimus]
MGLGQACWIPFAVRKTTTLQPTESQLGDDGTGMVHSCRIWSPIWDGSRVNKELVDEH